MQSHVQNYMQSSIIMPMVCAKTKAEKIAIQNAATAEWVSLIQCGHPSGVTSTCKFEKKYGISKSKTKEQYNGQENGGNNGNSNTNTISNEFTTTLGLEAEYGDPLGVSKAKVSMEASMNSGTVFPHIVSSLE
jgi:hypothetical protein